MATVATHDIRAALDARIREGQAEVGKIERESRDRVREVQREVRALEKARAMLANTDVGGRSKNGSTSVPIDPAKRAGPKAIRLVSEYIEANGPVFQSQMVKDLPLQPSVVSYAVRALREAKQIKSTGNSFRASHEYEWVGEVEKPGEVDEPVGTSQAQEERATAAAQN